MSDKELLMGIFNRLLESYGPRKWWPATTRFEVIVGAILTQNVSWKNAKIAIDNLKKANLLSPKAIVSKKKEIIAKNIRTSRFYNQKTDKLKVFCKHLIKKYNGSLNKMFSHDAEYLRKELLELKGIGKETADCILLYAGKKLSFVSDAYTERFLKRFGLMHGHKVYDEIRTYFMTLIPRDVYVYNEFHALIVHHCYATCRATPECNICPIRNFKKNISCHFWSKSK